MSFFLLIKDLDPVFFPDPDPDSGDPKRLDPTKSGSATLMETPGVHCYDKTCTPITTYTAKECKYNQKQCVQK